MSQFKAYEARNIFMFLDRDHSGDIFLDIVKPGWSTRTGIGVQLRVKEDLGEIKISVNDLVTFFKSCEESEKWGAK